MLWWLVSLFLSLSFRSQTLIWFMNDQSAFVLVFAWFMMHLIWFFTGKSDRIGLEFETAECDDSSDGLYLISGWRNLEAFYNCHSLPMAFLQMSTTSIPVLSIACNSITLLIIYINCMRWIWHFDMIEWTK